MIIQRLEVNNFRSLKSVDIECDEPGVADSRALVGILGRNGGGKSSILYALEVFYDVGARPSKEDCYGRDPANEIMIRVTYGNLRPDERAEFQSYIEGDKLIITKRIQVGGATAIAKYFAAAKQIPKFAELRLLGKRDRLAKFKELVAAATFDGLVGSPRSGDEVDTILAEYERTHHNLLETVEREEQFFGPKEVGGGKLDKFTKFVLVPAVRLASVEIQKKGVIYELIDTIVLRRVNQRADVQALRQEMKEKIEQVFCQQNLTELGELGGSISTLLDQYAPGASLKLTWDAPVTPVIPLPAATADLVEDDYPCPISHAGHGLQRALVLTLLQQLATTQAPPALESITPANAFDAPAPTESGAEDASGPAKTATTLNPDLILAIEEPELYLHPSRCRYLSELLYRLAAPPGDTGAPRTQILYATHSPYFVDLHRFDQIRIARKPRVDGLPAPCCMISRYSLDAAAKELGRISGKDAKAFTRDSFRARALPVMTTAVNEGFFASTVVVVEGLSDVGVIWRVQDILKQNWSALGIAVVPAMGKENLDRPVVIFRGLKIPTYFVFDADGRHKGKKNDEASTASRNARYLRLAGVDVMDFPPTQVRETWAAYANDVEATIVEAVGSADEFNSIAQKAVDELKYDGPKALMKNTEGAARVVELVYESGHTIPVVEEIVKAVTALRAAAIKAETIRRRVAVEDKGVAV